MPEKKFSDRFFPNTLRRPISKNARGGDVGERDQLAADDGEHAIDDLGTRGRGDSRDEYRRPDQKA